MSYRAILRAAALSALLAASAVASVAVPFDEAGAIGAHMPDVELVADDGTRSRVSALWGRPVVVSPVFTGCSDECAQITERLRDASRAIREPGAGYEVLTFSLDPADDPAAMRAYRARFGLPAGWRLAVASDDARAQLLAAMDFRATPSAEGGLAHPHAIAILSPDLTVGGHLRGATFTGDALRSALGAAARRSSLVTRLRPLLALVAGMGAFAVAWALYHTRRRSIERA